MGFFDRNRKELAAKGIDPDRLPPGQYATERFPVLHVGSVPVYRDDRSDWSLRIFGAVEREVTLGWTDLLALPTVDVIVDIHCVTKWSMFDSQWHGVRIRDVLAQAGVASGATHVLQHAEFGYTTNTPLPDLLGDDCLIAWEYGGLPLTPEHGGPVRVMVPHLYFWKSAKWVRGLEVLDHDEPGFWERNGYHDYGDPFREQRFSDD